MLKHRKKFCYFAGVLWTAFGRLPKTVDVTGGVKDSLTKREDIAS